MPVPEQALSYETVVLPHLDAAYNLARWLTRNEHDAEDVFQEACLRAFRFFMGYRGGDSRAWLLKIVRHTCYTWLQANRPRQDAAEFDESLVAGDTKFPNPEQLAVQSDNHAVVRRALERLAPVHRELLVLRELEGLSYREIAEVTGLPIGTVMSRLARARDRLRQALTMPVAGLKTPN